MEIKPHLFLIVLFGFCNVASSASLNNSTSTLRPQSTVSNSAFVALGLQTVGTQDSMSNVQFVNSQSYSIGFRQQAWTFSFDYDRRRSDSGNATLSIDRFSESYLLGANWSYFSGSWVSAFIGGGGGFQSETVQSTLYGNSDVDRSRPYQLWYASFGLDSPINSWFFWSLQARLYFGDKTEPNPSPGILSSIGLQKSW